MYEEFIDKQVYNENKKSETSVRKQCTMFNEARTTFLKKFRVATHHSLWSTWKEILRNKFLRTGASPDTFYTLFREF